MARSKNKPKKTAADAAGKTEVIAGPGSTTTPVTVAPVAAPAVTDAIPTFTKIGMAGMIGLLGSDAAVAVAEPPADVAEPQAVADAAVAEPPADVAEPQAVADAAVAEPPANADEPTNQKEEAIVPPTAPAPAPVGFFGYLRSFFSGFGQAIHR